MAHRGRWCDAQMNLLQIRTFIWVVKLGGFRRAADKLNASQASVSARIASLEERVGYPLLDRAGRGAQPTAEGREFLSYAEKVLFLTEDLEARIGDPSRRTGTLRLGISETIVHSWLPQFVSKFAETYPLIDLDLSVDVTVNLRDALLSRSIDLAFLMGPVSEFTVANVELPSFELAWLAGRRTAKRIEHDGRDAVLRDMPFVTFARNTRPFGEVKALLSEHFGSSVRLFPTTSLAAGYELVRQDVAIGALPRTLADRYGRNGRKALIELDLGRRPAPLHFTASFVTDPPNLLTSEAAALAQMVTRVADN